VLSVLLWQRARDPFAGAWCLPGGYLEPGETLEESIRRHLAVKVDATAYLGLVRTDVDPVVPADTAWHPLESLPPIAFDHERIALAGRDRLRAKLGYTNLGFALAPETFTMAELRDLYAAALGHDVSPTNL